MAVAALEVEELRCKLGPSTPSRASRSRPQGRTAGLIGPNGAGKSTLVGLIAGARLPDAGTVTLFGEDITRLPAWKRSRLGLARTFQLSSQFARLTVLENLMVACRDKTGETLWGALFQRRRWRAVERVHADRAWELLERFRLEHKANEYAGLRSGGENAWSRS